MSYDSFSDAKTIEKVKVVLQKMDVLLDGAQNGDESRFERSRREFVEKYQSCYDPNFDALNFSFSLSAEEIVNKTMREIVAYTGPVHPDDVERFIDKKMGRGIIGCTGTAKLFCALAQKEDLACQVVMTVDGEQWRAVKAEAQQGIPIEQRQIINGHQIIAVELEDGLHAFDPGYKAEQVDYGLGYIERRKTKFLDLGKAEIGQLIDMPRFKGHFVTAIISPQEYAKVKSYQDIANLYSSGKMDDSSFTVRLNFPRQQNVVGSQKPLQNARSL